MTAIQCLMLVERQEGQSPALTIVHLWENPA